MDLRMFFQKLRKIEQEIATPHVVVVSVDTPDGGKDGVKTEVIRESAAKLVVEGKARLATPEETEEFHKGMKIAAKEREREQIASRLTVNVLSDEDFASLRKPGRKQDQ
jgi:hypothetical protein